jgi:hypothetical protein
MGRQSYRVTLWTCDRCFANATGDEPPIEWGIVQLKTYSAGAHGSVNHHSMEYVLCNPCHIHVDKIINGRGEDGER